MSKNIYSLPFGGDIKTMALSDKRVHFGNFKEAIDFIMPFETPIKAAEEGIIKEVKLNSKKGGSNPKYGNLKYLNYIIIEHKNNEYTTYGHLKYKSSKFKKGDKIKKGEVIALSGKSGLMNLPHLHFHVFIKIGKERWKTIRPTFEEKINIHSPNNRVPKSEKNLFNYLRKIWKQF